MTDETQKAPLLVELGCEELPPKALDTLASSFFDGVRSGLHEAGIDFDEDSSRCLASPRRLALLLENVAPRQPDRTLDRKGPSVAAAFDDEGKPTAAAEGFARSVGVAVDELERQETDKGEWLFCRVEQPGQPLSALIFPIIAAALDRLPVPKPMRWSDHDFHFVRPVHWLVVMHGTDVIEGSLYGCDAGNVTRGHRIHAPGPHALSHAGDYLAVLEAAFVMADPTQRIERIRQQAIAQGESLSGTTRITSELLAEVNNLVEWPVALTCAFDQEFLGVPPEALIASMESHQKFFPILDAEQKLTRHFVVIANLESKDTEAMARGYERVIRPRLADAQFFWQQDLKSSLASQLSSLDKVVFQKDLGSVGDKSRRISELAGAIAELAGTDGDTAKRAALLSKCDLVTQMVGEFPELQGIMGGYYARNDQEPTEVAQGIAEHYHPRFAGDAIPGSQTGCIVSLADRLDTLVGIFAIGLKPTGNKDPFALRRATLGIIRILESSGLALQLVDLLAAAADNLKHQVLVDESTRKEIHGFVIERLRNHLREGGASSIQASAVLAAPLNTLPDLHARLKAVQVFFEHPESESLVAANKRIGNILKKQGFGEINHIDTDRFILDEERRLFEDFSSAESEVVALFDAGEYARALVRLAALRPAVDAYFDAVMVMDKDPDIRANRLAQLSALKQLFDRVADFSG